MYRKISVSLGNLILSLSDALDLAFSSLAMHQQRTAFVAWTLAEQAKLPKKRVENVFLAGLLHDIGALSVEEKKSLHDNEQSDLEVHSIRGQHLYASNPWLAPSADLVRYHHRAWDTWESPRNAPVVFDSQVLYLADYLERQIDRNAYILHQRQALCSQLKELADKKISGEIIGLFLELSQREDFWLDLTSPRLYSLLMHHGPFQTIALDSANIATFARLLSMIVDFKSPFTAAHSVGVAQCSMLLAEMAGMTGNEVDMIEIAGLLHDIGKMVVPNAILESPTSLTPAEFDVVKQHSYHSFAILNSIGGLKTITEWSSFHHERIDGKGYPFRCKGHEIDLGARILAVSDIFTALTEDRPYRKGMTQENIKIILQDLAANGIHDRRIIKLALENMGDIIKVVNEKQQQARHYYHTEVEKSG